MTMPEIAEEPGGIKIGDRLPESTPSHEMTLHDLQEGQWFWVYSTMDGSRSRLNINMRQYIDPMNPRAWRNANGQIAFSLTRPTNIPEVQGNKIMCLLHPKNPIRPHLDEIGLRGRYCKMGDAEGGKANLASDFDLVRHMQKSHSGEYRIIQDNQASVERARDREERNAAMNAQLKTAEAMSLMAERFSNDNSESREGQGSSAGTPSEDTGRSTEGDGFTRRSPGRPKRT